MRIPVHCATYATLQSVVNFSTYSDRKSCNTSTTLQNSVARFVSDSWASVAVAAASKHRRRNRSCWVSDFNFDSMVFINIHEVSTLLPIRSTLLPIRSTFNEVDRVEFNFVVSVYRALHVNIFGYCMYPYCLSCLSVTRVLKEVRCNLGCFLSPRDAISAAYSVMRCLCVCHSRSSIPSKLINVSSNFYTIG